ncbi:MAG TPA: S9 family peptidase [Candidatus Saccharimonadales bacterium]|nr:S9 family peptidase [Candidatus Saccharimonadales bacterium]
MSAHSKRPLTVEDLWALDRVAPPAISPDGALVVVPVTRYDLEKNEGRTRLWALPGGGGEARALTAEDVSSREPAVSPDGRRLAFVRARDKDKPQLHVMPLDGGEAVKLTDLPLGCSDPHWLPDSRRVALLVPLLREAPTVEGTRELAGRREQDPVKAHVTEDRVYRYWDRWLTDGEVPHLFVLDTVTRELRDLTPASERWFDLMDSAGQFDVSPDGGEIAFSADASAPPHTHQNYDIFTVPVGGGAVRNLTAANPAHDVRPRYSPDGRWILYGMQRETTFYADRVRLVRYDRQGGTHTVLTEDWDRSAEGWEWSPDGSKILLHAEDRGSVALYELAPAPGTPRELHRGGTLSGLRPARGGGVFFAQDSLSAPPEVAAFDAGGAGFRWVSRFNRERLAGLDLGQVRDLEFEGSEGRRIQMRLVLPPGFDERKKWPLVHMIHGGPHGIFGDQFHFRWNAPLFAAPGYVVALVNFHGSTSWGQDFARCIQGGWGDRPFRDIMLATDHLERLPFIDGSRMAATGGSYGGYLVSWIAGHTDRFACLVNHAGVSDTQGQLASDVTEDDEASLGGAPWGDLGGLDRWNPVRFAASFKTPMLVVHGQRDYRVPYQQGLQIYACYKARGLTARLVVFPDENHWVLKPQNSRLWYREVHAWLARYLKT